MRSLRITGIDEFTRGTPSHHGRRTARSGLSLIEVVASTLIVALILVTALKCVGSIIRSRAEVGDRIKAQMLGDQLLREILSDRYIDEGALPLFGPELLEPLTSIGPRSGWDDVDDYHLWSRSPPRNRDNTTIPNLTGWQRSVVVQWVDPANPANTSLTDQGVKRIIVTVSRNGKTLATCVALRTNKYSIQ